MGRPAHMVALGGGVIAQEFVYPGGLTAAQAEGVRQLFGR